MLQAGDTLLLQGTWKALDVRLNDPDVLVVNSPELVRRQAVPLGAGAKQAIVILIAMVVLLATGVVPPAVAGLLAAGAIILSGDHDRRAVLPRHRLDDRDPRRRHDAAVDRHDGDRGGEADGRAPRRGSSATPARSRLLAGLFLLTAIMGQLISNTATALIVIPIGVAAATAMGISPRPVLMSIGGRRRRRVPDADRHADQSDGDGAGRLCCSATTGSSVCRC